MQKKHNTRPIPIIWIILSGLFLITLGGCGDTKKPVDSETEEKICHTLSQRQTAIMEKDIELYKSCISLTYKDKKDDFETIIKKMKLNFDFFKKIEFSTSNRTIYLKGDTVKVVQDYKLVAFVNGARKLFQGSEKIFFQEEDGLWRIIKGL